VNEDGEIEENIYDSQKHLSVQLDLCYHKVVRHRKDKGLPINCPFIECKRSFIETGNLKTHMRIHVSAFFLSETYYCKNNADKKLLQTHWGIILFNHFRLEKDHLSVPSLAVESSSLLKDIKRHTS